MALVIRPLTAATWHHAEDLFEDSPVCQRCWCMYWRVGNAYRSRAPERNKAELRRIVEQGPSPGLIAFDAGTAVGWCQVTPRAAVPWLDRVWRLARPDEAPVWSITCFYTRKSHRKRGITEALTLAAMKQAKRARAPALEAYPLDRKLTPSATSTGVLTTFARLGFQTVARHTPSRPIVRYRFAKE